MAKAIGSSACDSGGALTEWWATRAGALPGDGDHRHAGYGAGHHHQGDDEHHRAPPRATAWIRLLRRGGAGFLDRFRGPTLTGRSRNGLRLDPTRPAAARSLRRAGAPRRRIRSGGHELDQVDAELGVLVHRPRKAAVSANGSAKPRIVFRMLSGSRLSASQWRARTSSFWATTSGSGANRLHASA